MWTLVQNPEKILALVEEKVKEVLFCRHPVA
jgi:hypothetical protein